LYLSKHFKAFINNIRFSQLGHVNNRAEIVMHCMIIKYNKSVKHLDNIIEEYCPIMKNILYFFEKQPYNVQAII